MADTLSVDTWYHIALVRSGNTFKIFRNGAQIGSDYTDTDGLGNLAAGVMIGRFRQSSPTYDLNGWLDEFRISKGIARWTSNFTPPNEEYSYIDTTPPTTTASPTGGTYDSAQSVTLTCTDGSGSGCDKIYYTTDGTTPTTSSPVYASPINILVTTVLKFMAKDMGGTFETVQSQTYTISYGGCANPPVKIGSTFYLTLQAAYDAAGNGDTIRCRNVQLDENLTVNRNITVTLEGGYDCGYTTNYGATTPVKGSITTTSGGGTITIKNVTLEQ